MAYRFLSLSSHIGTQIALLSPGRCQALFGPEICPIDGSYLSSPVEFSFNTTFAPAKQVSLTILRSADILGNFAFKVTMPLLPQGIKWKRNVADLIFESIELITGTHLDTTLSLIKNNSMCKSRGLWPTFNNNPANIADPSSERWVLIIPVMFKNPIPVIKLYWHEVRINVLNVFKRWQDLTENMADNQDTSSFEIDAVLKVDGFFLEDKCRRGCAQDNLKPEITLPAVGHGLIMEKQDFTDFAECVSDGRTCIYMRTLMNGIVTHMILAYTVNTEIPTNSHPVNSISVSLNGFEFAIYDHVDLEEMNWLKCKMLSPISESKGKTMCKTFLYLIPFTFDPLSDFPTSWLEAGKFDNIILVISAKKGSFLPPGEIKCMYQSLNIRRYLTGMTGLVNPN